MILSAFLKLDSAAFNKGIGSAMEGVKSAIRISSDLGVKLATAFDLGSNFSNLSKQTGELPSTLAVLRQAFADTGVGADALGATLGLMRKSLGGVNEMGEPTGKMFQKLGLDIEALKGLGAEEQFQSIGNAIKNLGTPAEQTAAAMGVFGRSGASMLSLFKSDGAIDGARASLGELPALLDRNAAAFNNISTTIGHIKEKSKGLWAGVGEGLLPISDQITTLFDGLDLTGWGQRIGRFFGTITEMVQTAGWGKMISLLWEVGWKEAINYSVTALTEIGNFIFRLLSTPIAAVGAALQQLIEGVMLGLSKIPKVNAMLGLEGFEMTPIADAFAQIKDDIQDRFAFKGKIDLFDSAGAKAELAEIFNHAAVTYEDKIAEIQRKANEGAAQFGDASIKDNAVARKEKSSSNNALSDVLQRIGGSIGGTAPVSRMETLARDTLGVSRDMLRTLNQIANRGGSNVAVFG